MAIRWHNVQVTIEVMVSESDCENIAQDIPPSVIAKAKELIEQASDKRGYWFTITNARIIHSRME